MADDAGEDPDLNDDVGKLMQAYINEKCAPSILPYATELIGIMIDMIELQEEKMQDENDLPPADVRRPYYELELERMRWLVRAYLRTRLHKLNTHAVDIYSSAELKSRLSPAEVEYVEGYLRLVSGHVQATVTDRLDPGDDNAHLLGEGDLANMLPALRDAIVFCRMEADAGTVDLGVGIGSHDLHRGDIVVSRYSDIEPLLLSGRPGSSTATLL